MSPDELELHELDRLTDGQVLSDADLESISGGLAKGYGYGGYGYPYRRSYWSVGRVSSGSFRGFSGFGRAIGSIGRGVARAGRR